MLPDPVRRLADRLSPMARAVALALVAAILVALAVRYPGLIEEAQAYVLAALEAFTEALPSLGAGDAGAP